MNCRVAAPMSDAMPGVFHVTNLTAWREIVQDGAIVAGVDLCDGGRYDIHVCIAPPWPNDAMTQRTQKKFNRTGDVAVIISLQSRALALGDVRINQQGYVLQRAPILWGHIDYAIMMEVTPDGGVATALFLHGDFGQPEVVANTGCSKAEWNRWLQ